MSQGDSKKREGEKKEEEREKRDEESVRNNPLLMLPRFEMRIGEEEEDLCQLHNRATNQPTQPNESAPAPSLNNAFLEEGRQKEFRKDTDLALLKEIRQKLHRIRPYHRDIAKLSRMNETLSCDLVMDVLGDLDSDLHACFRPHAQPPYT